MDPSRARATGGAGLDTLKTPEYTAECAEWMIRQPDHWSGHVVGFDDIPLAAAGSYQLTTVAYPIQPTVAAIVETLEDRLAGADWPSRVIRIPTRLVVRGTTRRLERAVGARTEG